MKSMLLAAIFALLAVSPVLTAQEISASHLKTAAELLEAMQLKESTLESIDVSIEAMIRQMPQLAEVKDVIRTFMRKYLTWETLSEHYSRFYAEAFTEQELREITAFYRTETGRKAARLTPTLLNKGMMLGQELVQEHMPELQQLIQENMQPGDDLE